MSLAFIHQIAKIFNSNTDLVRSLNTALLMMMDYLPVRNPQILVRDSVYNRYYIDVAPELDEEQKNRWNHQMMQSQKTTPLKVKHQMVLYPGENDFMLLPQPTGVNPAGLISLWQPVVFKQQNLPLSLLVVQVKDWDRVSEMQMIFNILADIMAVAMVARGVPIDEIEEAKEPTEVEVPRILGGIIGEDSSLKVLAETIRRVANSKATVLIHGESGTGKELFAKALHENSIHKKAPFIGVNCAALSDNLLESELFGHEKGAFTGALSTRKGRFELADGGTLFLDEIGDTSLSFQTKILRVLQEGTFERLGGTESIHVDVRILCATNVDLEEAIAQGKFREDLYYRLNVIRLEIPPLRSRKGDIPHLVTYFLNKFNAEDHKNVAIRPEDMAYLANLDWPGNVRELENFVHSGFLMERGGFFYLDPSHNPRSAPKNQAPQPSKSLPVPVLVEEEALEAEEMEKIQQALHRAKGIQTKAADSLGISLRQLRYRIQKYKIPVRKF